MPEIYVSCLNFYTPLLIQVVLIDWFRVIIIIIIIIILKEIWVLFANFVWKVDLEFPPIWY